MIRNYKLLISYDGTRYRGWERQPGTDMTIQGKIEHVLARMCDVPADEVDVIAAGRTDAGVHARAMCAHVRLDTEKAEAEILAYLNTYLPEDIAVTDCKVCSDRFHARYNATGKTYRYTCYAGDAKPVFDRKYVTVLERMPDIGRMREAAVHLTGTHDFKSFSLNKTKKSTVRTVDTIDIRGKGGYLTITYHGNGFLRGMVRILTGTLIEAGYGNITPEDMIAIRDACDRARAGPSAPAQGLTLISVDYD
ncbi:MAG: tRNA pseudouridine(38-40) synthase TruA [Lachnospiraceae bacterium]|nr:tRNA pseudouridine(38-40) synthase TruA [Lachnospiraceae bacterium]